MTAASATAAGTGGTPSSSAGRVFRPAAKRSESSKNPPRVLRAACFAGDIGLIIHPVPHLEFPAAFGAFIVVKWHGFEFLKKGQNPIQHQIGDIFLGHFRRGKNLPPICQ